MAVFNFENPKNGKKFAIGHYTSVVRNGKIVYLDRIRGEQLVDPETGDVLVSIKKQGKIEAPMVIDSLSKRLVRNQKHFKEIAKNHAKTDEMKAEKRKNLQREIKGMTK